MALPRVLASSPPSAPNDRLRWFLTAALTLGLPADKLGDHHGCFETLSCVARFLLENVEVPDPIRRRLLLALDHCRDFPSAAQQAWLMRLGLEEVLSLSGSLDTFDLADGADQPLQVIKSYLGLALQTGSAADDAGDSAGCYEIYACTSRLLLAGVPGAYEARRLLKQAQQRSLDCSDESERAWVLREAFDEIIKGRQEALHQVQSYLSRAIELGAPAYDAGDPRGCYELYACVARMVLKTVAVPDEAQNELRLALKQSARQADPNAQAWCLRKAFDSILEQEVE